MVIRCLLSASIVLLGVFHANADDSQPAPMQHHIDEMRRSMEELRQTTDTGKRRQMMRIPMAKMRATMRDMRVMMDCPRNEPGDRGMHRGAMTHCPDPSSKEEQLEAVRDRQKALESMEQMLDDLGEMMDQ
jgi:hypothetical protein